MVAIDAGPIVLSGRRLSFGARLVVLSTAATFLLAVTVLAWNGFDAIGFRVASEAATRFASLIFFASIIAGPLCRLFPAHAFRAYGVLRRDILLAFCASYGVYILRVVTPHLLALQGVTPGMMLFAAFSAGILAAMAGAATDWFETRLGRPAQRAVLGVAAGYFWLLFTLAGIIHLNGPHRPDGYYGFCLLLMLAALLLRFADSFMIHLEALGPGRVTS